MQVSLSRASGRVDPFGLLVLAVVLALAVTIGIQAQASASDSGVGLGLQSGRTLPCLVGMRG
jgi:hypothetical protein